MPTTTTTQPTTTVPVTTTTPQTTTIPDPPIIDIKLGDVDENGSVDASDASLVLAAYARVSTGGDLELTEDQTAAADVNCDGVVDATDASYILAYYAYISTGGESTFEEFLKKMND